MRVLSATRKSILAAAAYLLCVAVAAQTTTADTVTEPEPDPVFDIEVIVFEYVGGVNGAREDWRYIDTGRDAAQAAARVETDVDTVSDAEDSIEQATQVAFKPLTFEVLTDDQMRLQDQLTTLRNSRDFRPLAHAGWRQPIYSNANETTLDLARVARLPATLDGTASVYVSRFLHLTLALELADNRVGGGTSTDSVIFSLAERRKMRSGELHFFDHPRFGALALISRTDREPPASAPSD